MKLLLHVDATEEGDPQSWRKWTDLLSPDVIGEFGKVFGEELTLFCPEAERYGVAEISVSFSSEADMREINENFRNMDEATDVLSFPLWEEDGRFVPAPEVPELLPLGDIVICPEEAGRLHEGLSPAGGLCLLLAHGFLHLLAQDHDTPEKEAAMWEWQDRIRTRLLDVLRTAEGAR